MLSVELIICCHLLNVEIDGFRSIPVLTDVVGLNCFVQWRIHILYQPTKLHMDEWGFSILRPFHQYYKYIGTLKGDRGDNYKGGMQWSFVYVPRRLTRSTYRGSYKSP